MIRTRTVFSAILSLAVIARPAAQGISTNDLYRVRNMLRDGYESVKKYYYDPTYHGVDLDARYQDYQQKLKTAASLNAGVTMVASFLEELKDSHTFFDPPARPYQIEYGYRAGFIGDEGFITRVRPGTDAAGKLKPGDRILSLNGGPVTRDTFELMQYRLNVLMPQSATKFVLRDPAGVERQVVVNTKVVPGKRVLDFTGADGGSDVDDYIKQAEQSDHQMRQQYVERGDVMIWKMPIFAADSGEIDRLWSVARRHASLILDLRGNPGGLIDLLARMIGSTFDRDVEIARRTGRAGASTLTAKTRGANAFGGKLVVLIDSASGSAAELYARVIQLEKRGIVVGDRSSGSVMEARRYPFTQGGQSVLVYEFSITEADMIMKDGRSLESVGVTPDETVLPSPADLAAGRDPVLARAAALVGLTLDPIAAGKLFPFEWQPM